MRLSHLDHRPVFHVVQNAHDIEQVYTLNGHRNPFLVTNAVMAAANFSWLAWAGDEPVAVFGATPQYAGVWSVYLLTTDKFSTIAIPLTRFAKKEVVPKLFNDLGAHRLQVDLHEANTFIHRWVEALGGRKEGVKERYAPDGSNYLTYVLLKEVDKSDKTV